MESSSVVVNMAKTKELSEDLRMSIVNAHKDGKGYKATSKLFSVPISTVQCNIKKYKNFNTVKKISASVDGSQRYLLVWLGKSAARSFPTPEQQSRHFRTTWVRWAPRFQRRQSAAHCTKKGCMGVVPERPLSSLTGIAKLDLHLPESTETRIKASGHQFYGHTRR